MAPRQFTAARLSVALCVIAALLWTCPTGLAVAGQKEQPEPVLALTGVTLIDGSGATPVPNTTLLIAGDRIADIFPTGAKPLPPNATVRNLGGRFVIPGLIDTHVHVSEGTPDHVLARLRRTLRGGVTAVREMASNCRLLAEIAARAARGEVEAADVYFSAHIVGPDVRTHPTHGAMATPEVLEALGPGCVQIPEGTIDAVQVVSAAKATGASALKIYGDVSADVVRRLTAEAHRQGLRVWAHAAVFPARPGDIVEAGVDVMSHSDLFVWEAADRLPDHYYASVGLAPFERVAPTDLAVERVLRTMARRGTVLDATLLVYEPEGAHPGRVANPQAWAAAGRWAAALTRRARELGVAVAAGTDALGAEPDGELPHLHRELELLVTNSGFSPLEAITAATRTAARALGAEDTRGTIAAGKLADLVVLRADPTADIRNTRAIEFVMKRGKVVEGTER
jgi:imidazolonepropionase-like amidohydrolase